MANFDPTSLPGVTPVSSGGSSGGFDPSSLPGVTPVSTSSSGSGVLSTLKDIGAGAINIIDNNPISRGVTSLAAIPVQLAAKAVGAPDPFAGGIGAGNNLGITPVGVTSSDQSMGKYAEEEAGNAATVGSTFVPVGAAADAITGGAGLLGVGGRIAAQAVLGAGQGAAGAMQSGGSGTDIASGAKMGAATAGALSTAGELGSAFINSLSETTGATKLQAHVQSGGAAKTLTRAFNDSSTATTNPIQTMEQNNLIKDLKVIDSTVNTEDITNPARTGSLDNLIQDQQDMGTQSVGQMKGGINTEEFKQSVISSIKSNPSLQAAGTVGKTVAEVGRRFDDYAESYGETIPYKAVNAIRVAMNKQWDPETWDAEKAIGNSARAALYTGKGAGPALQSAMQNEQELINTKEFLSKLNGTKVKGGQLTKIIAEATAAGVGATAGATIPVPFVGPALGAGVSAYAAKKAVEAMQGNYFNPMVGNAARSIGAFVPRVSAAKTLGQAALIPSLAGGGNQQNQ